MELVEHSSLEGFENTNFVNKPTNAKKTQI